MRQHYIIFFIIASFTIILAAACTRTPTDKVFQDYDSNNFDNSTSIDNQWLPLKPGTQWVFEGYTIENNEQVLHRVVIIVTDLTKIVDGVASVVTWDQDFSAGQLVEAELAFFAQDNEDTVWRMGEYPEEYEDGKFVDAPAWIHGIDDALAGIAMQSDPQPNTPDYPQGWGPDVDWTDRGQVDQVGQSICVPFNCYENVLVIAESSKSEPGAFQLKYYAAGTGNVKVDWRGEDQTQETLELVELVHLSSDGLAAARAEALKLETHAYQVSDVYSQSLPMELPDDIPALESNGVEVIVYASDLPGSALFELDFLDDPASPGNKMIGLPNNGDELDAPPENDPHVTFKVPIQSGIPYRCWIHMRVGAPKGKSQANLFWVQFSGAVNKTNADVFRTGTNSYLTAQGPEQPGWTWVGCDLTGSPTSESLVYFRASEAVTVRLQAGMEGVGFDQFILSPADFLEAPPSEPVVEK
jgi:hypothetical protein